MKPCNVSLLTRAHRHGGSGVVVSWGCAADVVRLAAGTAGVGPTLRARRLPADAAAGLPSLQAHLGCARL